MKFEYGGAIINSRVSRCCIKASIVVFLLKKITIHRTEVSYD